MSSAAQKQTWPMRFAVAAVLALMLATPLAQAVGAVKADATIVDSKVSYQIQSDGRHVVEDIGSLRVETQQAVQRFAQVPIPYSSTLQQLDVLAAYVISNDGKRTDVPADRIMVQQTPQSAGAPMFDDGKVKVVVFPGVEVGAVLHLHTRRTQIKPLFPGHFSAVETALGVFDIERAEITVQAPAGLKLNVDAVGMAGGKVESTLPGTQAWRHGALPELRRRAEDHRGDHGAAGDREDPEAPGSAGRLWTQEHACARSCASGGVRDCQREHGLQGRAPPRAPARRSQLQAARDPPANTLQAARCPGPPGSHAPEILRAEVCRLMERENPNATPLRGALRRCDRPSTCGS